MLKRNPTFRLLIRFARRHLCSLGWRARRLCKNSTSLRRTENGGSSLPESNLKRTPENLYVYWRIKFDFVSSDGTERVRYRQNKQLNPRCLLQMVKGNGRLVMVWNCLHCSVWAIYFVWKASWINPFILIRFSKVFLHRRKIIFRKVDTSVEMTQSIRAIKKWISENSFSY